VLRERSRKRGVVMKRRIGVVLSGCGVQDGAEIHEATLTLLALDRADAEAICMAPDRDQMHVVDHTTGNPTDETRNVLVEAARIARGDIRNVAEVKVEDLDGVVLPGGFGAAKNLCTFAVEGPDCEVDSDTARLLREMYEAGKPIAALCIAPAILASLFGKDLNPQITIGTDKETAKALETMGARHKNAAPTEVVVDREHRLVTTPCYMSATRIRDIADGANGAVRELLVLVEESEPATA
jgi:enhancing lycopene biosynthesis protein 2